MKSNAALALIRRAASKTDDLNLIATKLYICSKCFIGFDCIKHFEQIYSLFEVLYRIRLYLYLNVVFYEM